MKPFTSLTKHDRFLRDIRSHLIGSTASIQRREGDWGVKLATPFYLTVEGLWRLLSETNVCVTSDDDGQQYGLPAPIDAEEKANSLLVGKAVQSIELDRCTGDLQFTFEGAFTLEIITNSMGYETWQVWRSQSLFAVGANGGVV